MIHLVAEIKAFPDHIEQVTQLLTELLAPTREEEGCCQYELYLDEKSRPVYVSRNVGIARSFRQALTKPSYCAMFFYIRKERPT